MVVEPEASAKAPAKYLGSYFAFADASGSAAAPI
jgi:hypothetical protein